MEDDTPGENQGYFYVGLVTVSPKSPGGRCRNRPGQWERDPLEAALPLKNMFLIAQLSPCLAGMCFMAVAAEMQCCFKQMHWDQRQMPLKRKRRFGGDWH